jgi:hypothetical protein
MFKTRPLAFLLCPAADSRFLSGMGGSKEAVSKAASESESEAASSNGVCPCGDDKSPEEVVV